jgi:hypothetical protein
MPDNTKDIKVRISGENLLGSAVNSAVGDLGRLRRYAAGQAFSAAGNIAQTVGGQIGGQVGGLIAAGSRIYTAAATGAAAGGPIGAAIGLSVAAFGELVGHIRAVNEEMRNLKQSIVDFRKEKLAANNETLKGLTFPVAAARAGLYSNTPIASSFGDLIGGRVGRTINAISLAQSGQSAIRERNFQGRLDMEFEGLWRGLVTNNGMSQFEAKTEARRIMDDRIAQDKSAFNTLGGHIGVMQRIGGIEAGVGAFGTAAQAFGMKWGNYFGNVAGDVGGAIGLVTGRFGRGFTASQQLLDASMNPAEAMSQQFQNLKARVAMGEITPAAFGAASKALFLQGIGMVDRPGFHPLQAVESHFLTRGADTPTLTRLEQIAQQAHKEEQTVLLKMLEEMQKDARVKVEIKDAR